LLGDDLYAHQPFCRQALLHNFHFIFTCKPSSHTYLSQWVEALEAGRDLHIRKWRVKGKGNRWEHCHYRWANQVPLTEGADALKVNWCELTVTQDDGAVLYRNAFITDWNITEQNVSGLVAAGRARWKIENENNNVLKTKGYHLEHNFGHGKQYLSATMLSLNLLAFLFHTVLRWSDEQYALLRQVLVRRQTFFEDMRALTRYMVFESWHHLMDFMIKGRQLESKLALKLRLKLDTS